MEGRRRASLLVVEVGKTVTGVARSNRSSAMRLWVRWWRAGNLGPAHFEETAHPVSRLAHRTVVLVEYLAVDEHLSHIGAKLIARLVPVSRSTRLEHFCLSDFDPLFFVILFVLFFFGRSKKLTGKL